MPTWRPHCPLLLTNRVSLPRTRANSAFTHATSLPSSCYNLGHSLQAPGIAKLWARPLKFCCCVRWFGAMWCDVVGSASVGPRWIRRSAAWRLRRKLWRRQLQWPTRLFFAIDHTHCREPSSATKRSYWLLCLVSLASEDLLTGKVGRYAVAFLLFGRHGGLPPASQCQRGNRQHLDHSESLEEGRSSCCPVWTVRGCSGDIETSVAIELHVSSHWGCCATPSALRRLAIAMQRRGLLTRNHRFDDFGPFNDLHVSSCDASQNYQANVAATGSWVLDG